MTLLLGVGTARLVLRTAHGAPAAARSATRAKPDAAQDSGVRPAQRIATARGLRTAAPNNPILQWRTAVPPESGTVIGEFDSRLRAKFELRRIICSVDNAIVYDRPTAADEVVLFRRVLAPGKHVVSLMANYDGDPDSPSSFLEGYHFDVFARRPFVVRRGDTTLVSITGQESPTGDFRDRLSLAVNVSEEPSRALGRHRS